MSQRLGSSGLWLLAGMGTAALVSACSPLSESTLSTGGCGISVTSDAGIGSQQKVYSGSIVAQSFLVSGASVILNNIQLKLQAEGVTPPTTLSGTLQVYIEKDGTATSSSNPLPTSPSGSYIAQGSLDVSTITSTTPTFYTIGFGSTSAQLSPTAVYWVVAYYSGGSSSQYVGWEAANTTVLANQIVQIGTTTTGPWTTTSGITMDVQGGC